MYYIHNEVGHRYVFYFSKLIDNPEVENHKLLPHISHDMKALSANKSIILSIKSIKCMSI